MTYVYKNLIPQNIAPEGALSLGLYNDDGVKITSIALGNLESSHKTQKSYSFGVVSDLHISHNPNVAWQPATKFDNALTSCESKGCAFCVACGDLTNTGYYLRTDESTAGTEYLDEQQFEKYKEICDKHSIPVYELCGNHESYYGQAITGNLDRLGVHTGEGRLTYAVEHGGDLLVFVGQPRDAAVMSDEDLQWLYETLETSRNKRCFVFVHSHMDGDSGNPLNARDNSIFGYWGATKTSAFKALMVHYSNTVLFHGHTHMMFESQQYDRCANYTDKNGFRSVHVPSLGLPRELQADGAWVGKDAESYGYIVDVYDDYIVLNGWDFVNNLPVPLGTYKIDTPLQTIPTGTFADSTGTIKTQ